MTRLTVILFIILLVPLSIIAQQPRNQTVAAGEYFVNNDPGEGNGISIGGSYNFWQVSGSVAGVNLPVGSRLYVRFKSTNGTWSAPRCIVKKEYFTNSGASLSYGEYYVNNDPGQGKGIALAIQNGINLNNLPLKRGDRVYFRLKDSFNRWGPSRAVAFTFKDIVRAEYTIKRYRGGQTDTSAMNISTPNNSNCNFSAFQNTVPARTNDTILVRFETNEHFYSKWDTVIESYPVNVKDVVTGLPTKFGLSQNYPNPFNPTTIIRYDLPTSAHVRLTVFDVLGREVATLVNGTQEAGCKSVEFSAANLPSGIYAYRLTAGTYVEVKKMLLLK